MEAPTVTATAPLLDVQEVADRLGVSGAMVRKLVRHRDIPVVRIGTALRFRAQDIDEFIANGGTAA